MDSLFGLTFLRWIQLLRDNKFNISIRSFFFSIFLSIWSIKNSIIARNDKNIFKEKNITFNDPIFILGHWRSGTTFLNNLLIQDNQFIYPKIYQVINPFTFHTLNQKYIKQIKSRKIEARPMDNVKNDPFLPGEEEFALAAITLKSPIVGWAFPKRFEFYEQYLTLENIPANDREIWKNEYNKFLKKIAFDGDAQKQLLLKSPVNTSRIKFLIELYPNAKFINIHRNPIDVFSSTLKLHNTAIKKSNLQGSNNYDKTERIISTYKKVYDSYFKAIDLIPKNNFIDVSFEELEREPIKILKAIYEKLSINGFYENESKFNDYIDSLKDYKKNVHKELNPIVIEKIKTNWQKYYKNWGYKI